MEEQHAIEVTDLVISYQNLKKTSIKKSLLHFKLRTIDRFVAVSPFMSVRVRFWESSARTEAANPQPSMLWQVSFLLTAEPLI